MDESSRVFEIFLEVQRGLPRQGPGCRESTLKALELCTGLPDKPAILDIGCGPGMQTVELASAVNGHVTAVDRHEEYLNQLVERAATAGVGDRVEALVGDMRELSLPPQSFDLVWSEGAAYIMGFEKALTYWKQFLTPTGSLAVSELVWIQPNPPSEVAEFFALEYPAMMDTMTVLDIVRSCGYESSGHFILPDAAWWQDYYSPLEAKLPSLSVRYAGDEEAIGVLAMTRREIDMRRRFGDWYGYAFFTGTLSRPTRHGRRAELPSP